MKINTNPVKGTIDYLPADMEIRQNTINSILSTFKKYGFLQVKTPILESLDILTSGDSGDNQKLMFKTIKRGDKLNLDKPSLTEADIAEEGLRYDLTVPLARLYAGNKDKLILPFKAIQIDESFRAEKPQRGRNRQFTQCDIDIWGDSSVYAEIQLLISAINAYKNIGITDVVIKISDRRILNSLMNYFNIEANQQNRVCVSLDKLDKIGAQKVVEEIATNLGGHMLDNAAELVNAIVEIKDRGLLELKKYNIESALVENLDTIIKMCKKFTNADVLFDITVIRGQSYYTGTVFECYTQMGEFKRAIGGGGRYDNMLEKFLNVSVPAVGYSIGLDPVVMLLKESNNLPNSNKIALVYPKTASIEEVFEAQQTLNNKGYDVCIFAEPKNYKSFCDKLIFCNFFALVKLENIDKIISL